LHQPPVFREDRPDVHHAPIRAHPRWRTRPSRSSGHGSRASSPSSWRSPGSRARGRRARTGRKRTGGASPTAWRARPSPRTVPPRHGRSGARVRRLAGPRPAEAGSRVPMAVGAGPWASRRYLAGKGPSCGPHLYGAGGRPWLRSLGSSCSRASSCWRRSP